MKSRTQIAMRVIQARCVTWPEWHPPFNGLGIARGASSQA